MVLNDQERAALLSFAHRIDASDAGAHNNLGALYYVNDLFEEAVEQFAGALELDSKMTVAQRNLELAHRRTGSYDQRVTKLRDRLRANPEDREARWELGKALAVLGQSAAAADEFRVLVSDDEKDLSALLQLALAEKAGGRMEEATQLLERACELDDQSSVVRSYLGETLYNRGLNREALDALTEAIKLNPEHADAHYLMAFVLGDLGRHEEARAATKRAIQLNPLFSRAHTNLSLERLSRDRKEEEVEPVLAESPVSVNESLPHLNLGLAFRQKGYYREAMQEYGLALDRGEDGAMVQQAMAEVYLLQRDFSAALELYDRLLQEVPDSHKLWNERGVVLHQLGRPADAIESYRRSVELESDYSLALNNLAVSLAQQGQNDDAVNALAEAVKRDRPLVTPQLNLGLLLFKLGRFELALSAFKKILESDQVGAAAWNGIGMVLTELGRREDARNAFARAVEEDPDSAEAHYDLSFALSALGDYDGALREVTRAQTLNPYYNPLKFRLAIDLQYEDPAISVVPEIAAEVTVESGVPLKFDQGLIDNLFAELDQPPDRPPQGATKGRLSLARDYLNKGLLDLAAAEVDRASGHDPEGAETQLLAGQIFARRGLHGEALERYRAARAVMSDRADARLGEVRQLLALGRGAEAIQEAISLGDEWPEDADILVTLAEARLAAGDPAKSLEALRLARQRAPHRADILKLEGDIAADMGDVEAARESYEDALLLNPRFAQVHFNLGRSYEADEDWKMAERCYRAALEALPTFVEAALALARVYRITGHPRTAVNLLADVLANDPSDLGALLALGHSLLDDGRLEASLQTFRRILAYDICHVGAQFFTGVVLARLHRYGEAIEQWEQVVSIAPDGPFAREARNHARSARDLQHIFRTGAA